MKLSQIKELKSFCEDLFSTPNWREVLEEVLNDNDDFTVDDVRFIESDSINDILASELESDEYVLGCFNSSFISDVTGWPMVLIEAAQTNEGYAKLGKAIIKEGFMEDLAKKYASADGYGHHFNSYDGSEEEVTINGKLYHVFDQH